MPTSSHFTGSGGAAAFTGTGNHGYCSAENRKRRMIRLFSALLTGTYFEAGASLLAGAVVSAGAAGAAVVAAFFLAFFFLCFFMGFAGAVESAAGAIAGEAGAVVVVSSAIAAKETAAKIAATSVVRTLLILNPLK
jgi:hypothetical protein